jgi:hypothetical protein
MVVTTEMSTGENIVVYSETGEKLELAPGLMISDGRIGVDLYDTMLEQRIQQIADTRIKAYFKALNAEIDYMATNAVVT